MHSNTSVTDWKIVIRCNNRTMSGNLFPLKQNFLLGRDQKAEVAINCLLTGRWKFFHDLNW